MTLLQSHTNHSAAAWRALTTVAASVVSVFFFFFDSTSTPTSATTTKMSTSPAPPTKRVRHVAPLQRTLSQLDSERAVGITEYLNPEAPGWRGVLKQRFVSLFPEKGAGRTTRDQEGLIGIYGKVYRLLGE